MAPRKKQTTETAKPPIQLTLSENDCTIIHKISPTKNAAKALGLTFWFLDKIGDPETARILLDMAIEASNKLNKLVLPQHDEKSFPKTN